MERAQEGIKLVPLKEALENLSSAIGSRYSLFVGAGVSIGAGIPGSGGVIEKLKARYPKRFQKGVKYEYAQALTLAFGREEGKSRRREFFEELCIGAVPGDEHRTLAHLVDDGFIPAIFTTNFDHLLEMALVQECSTRTRVHLYDDDIGWTETLGSNPRVVKLHGDFLFDDIANLPEETHSKITSTMREFFDYYLRSSGLIVLGYGGNDQNIMNLLADSATKPTPPKGLVWVVHKPEEVDNERIRYLHSQFSHRGIPIMFVGPTDAKEFLPAVAKGTGLKVPSKSPFGIGATLRNALMSHGVFGLGRQSPPEGRLGDTPDTRIIDGAMDPGITIVFGTRSLARNSAINCLCQANPFKTFYFHRDFAENPSALAFRDDLTRFADDQGMSLQETRSLFEVMEYLFNAGCTIVMDGLGKSGPPEKQLKGMLGWLIRSQIETGHGRLVVVLDSESMNEALNSLIWCTVESFGVLPAAEIGGTREITPQEMMARIGWSREFVQFVAEPLNELGQSRFIGFESSEPNHPNRAETARICQEMPEPIAWVLKVLVALRSAEPPETIGSLTNVGDLSGAIRLLVSHGFVDTRAGKILLHAWVREALANKELNAQECEDVAHAFEELARNKKSFRTLHNLMEAEYFYYLCHDTRSGLRVLDLAYDLLVSRNFEEFFYANASDYFNDIIESPDAFKSIAKLTPREIVDSLLTLRTSLMNSTNQNPSKEQVKFVNDVIDIFSSTLSEEYRQILAAEVYKSMGKNYDRYKKLEAAEVIFARRGSMTKDWALVCHRLAACLITLSPFPHPGLGSEFESRERVLQESERWSEKAIEIYSALGDQDEVRRVKIGLALARMKHGRPGDLDRGIKEFEELRKSMADVEGFSSEKAAIYGNLFLAYLGRGRAKTAEAYFYESNLNYQYTGGFYFVERHYVQLYQHVLGLDRMEPDLPEAGAFYKSLIASLSAPNEWRLVVAASRFPRLVDQENLEESVKVAEDLLSGGRFYLEGSSLKKWGTMMATYACLLFDPRARATFAQRTLEIVKREVPGQTPLYSCLFDYASQQGLEVENLEKERSLPDNDKWILEDRAHLLSVKPPEKERLIQGIRFLLEHASRDLSL